MFTARRFLNSQERVYEGHQTSRAPDWFLPLLARVCTQPKSNVLSEVRMEELLTHRQMGIFDRELIEQSSHMESPSSGVVVQPTVQIYAATASSHTVTVDSSQLHVRYSMTRAERISAFARFASELPAVQAALVDATMPPPPDSCSRAAFPSLVAIARHLAVLLAQSPGVHSPLSYPSSRTTTADSPATMLLAPVPTPRAKNDKTSDDDDTPDHRVRWSDRDRSCLDNLPAWPTSTTPLMEADLAALKLPASGELANEWLTVDSIDHPFTCALLAHLRAPFFTLLDSALTLTTRVTDVIDDEADGIDIKRRAGRSTTAGGAAAPRRRVPLMRGHGRRMIRLR